MTLISGILLILFGVGIMAFGLLLYYAMLPLFYGFFGFGVGYWLSLAITGNTLVSAGLLELILGFLGALLFALVAYFLEPARRILIGIVAGSSLGLAAGYALGTGGLVNFILAAIGAIMGVVLVLALFDPLIIVGSALAGAAMVMDGAHLILPGLGFLDRATIVVGGGLIPLVIWGVLGAVGLGWQFRNLEAWARSQGAAI